MFNRSISKFLIIFLTEKKYEFIRRTSNTNKCITHGAWAEMSLSLVHNYPEYGGSMLLRNVSTYLPEHTDVKSQKILNITRSYVNRTYVTTSNILSVTGKFSVKSILNSAVRNLDTSTCRMSV